MKSRKGTWNHFLLQESNEGGTSIPAAKEFPAMEAMSGHSWNEGRRSRGREGSSPCSRVWGSCKSPASQKNWEREQRSPARFCLAVVPCSSSTRNKEQADLRVGAQVWALQVQLRASSHQTCLEQPGQFLGSRGRWEEVLSTVQVQETQKLPVLGLVC